MPAGRRLRRRGAVQAGARVRAGQRGGALRRRRRLRRRSAASSWAAARAPTATAPTSAAFAARTTRAARIPGYCLGRDRREAGAYATPEVPIAPLPGVTGAIVASLVQRTPDGLSHRGRRWPGRCRTRGRAWTPIHPAGGVVLVSDGFPPSARRGIPKIAALARTPPGHTPRPHLRHRRLQRRRGATGDREPDAVARRAAPPRPSASARARTSPRFPRGAERHQRAALACEYDPGHDGPD